MHDRRVCLGLILLLGCKPGVEPAAPNAAPADAANLDAPLVAPVSCATAACFAELASAARSRGILDRASDELGRAHAAQPSDETLAAWLRAQADAGQWRAFARTLAEHELEHPGVVASFAALAQPPGVDRSLTPGPASPTIFAALVAEAEGRIDDAIAGLSVATEPEDLARLGDLLWQRGDGVEAHAAWSAARVELDERGATMRVVPIRRQTIEATAWAGDQLVLARRWNPIDPDAPASELQRWTLDGDPRPTSSFVLPGTTRDLGSSADGSLLYRTSPAALSVHDLATGRTVGRVDHDRFGLDGSVAWAVTGDRQHALIATPQSVQLRSLTGELLERWELEGTTPTITRSYSGVGSHHDDIIRDSPTWPVAVALTDDRRWVAIGGSDSKVRLIDRDRGTLDVLEYDWVYHERRHTGANSDLNLPLDMRFVDGGAGLWVVYVHGDVIRWRTRDAALERRLAPDCSASTECGELWAARFSADASLLATQRLARGLRVRETATGTNVATLDPELPDRMWSFSPDNRLALADPDGSAVVWSPTGGVVWASRPDRSRALVPALSRDGRYLRFELDDRWVIWDLFDNRDVSPTVGERERTLDVSPDGSHHTVLGSRGVELRRRDGAVVLAADVLTVFRFFGDGRFVAAERTGAPTVVRNLVSGVELDLPSDRESRYFDRRYFASADGSRIAVHDGFEELRVFDTRTAEIVGVTFARIDDAELGPDGAWLLTLSHEESADGPKSIAQLQALGAHAGPTATITLDGRAHDLAASASGDEVFIATGTQIVRWRPAAGTHELLSAVDLGIGPIQLSADGRLMFLVGYDRVDIHELGLGDGAQMLASIHPSPDGGWLATSASGSVDGSESAPANCMTVVEGVDTLIHAGSLAWDRFAVDGLIARIVLEKPVIQPTPARKP